MLIGYARVSTDEQESRLAARPAERGQPRNRAVADVVAAGDLAHRLSPLSRRLIASRCWCGVSFGLRPIFTPRAFARSRPSPVRARIRSRSNSASPPSTVSISRPCDVVVSAHASPSDRKPAFLPVMAARVFNRSRVDRASRSSRVTISTSPASSASITRRSCARSVLAPLAHVAEHLLASGLGQLPHLCVNALALAAGDTRA